VVHKRADDDVPAPQPFAPLAPGLVGYLTDPEWGAATQRLRRQENVDYVEAVLGLSHRDLGELLAVPAKQVRLWSQGRGRVGLEDAEASARLGRLGELARGLNVTNDFRNGNAAAARTAVHRRRPELGGRRIVEVVAAGPAGLAAARPLLASEGLWRNPARPSSLGGWWQGYSARRDAEVERRLARARPWRRLRERLAPLTGAAAVLAGVGCIAVGVVALAVLPGTAAVAGATGGAVMAISTLGTMLPGAGLLLWGGRELRDWTVETRLARQTRRLRAGRPSAPAASGPGETVLSGREMPGNGRAEVARRLPGAPDAGLRDRRPSRGLE
jgi:hypothetical protein